MWGIWCHDTNDWLRELPSKVDEGGRAVLAFEGKLEACKRAAKNYGFSSYGEAKRADWCHVQKLPTVERES